MLEKSPAAIMYMISSYILQHICTGHIFIAVFYTAEMYIILKLSENKHIQIRTSVIRKKQTFVKKSQNILYTMGCLYTEDTNLSTSASSQMNTSP